MHFLLWPVASQKLWRHNYYHFTYSLLLSLPPPLSLLFFPLLIVRFSAHLSRASSLPHSLSFSSNVCTFNLSISLFITLFTSLHFLYFFFVFCHFFFLFFYSTFSATSFFYCPPLVAGFPQCSLHFTLRLCSFHFSRSCSHSPLPSSFLLSLLLSFSWLRSYHVTKSAQIVPLIYKFWPNASDIIALLVVFGHPRAFKATFSLCPLQP